MFIDTHAHLNFDSYDEDRTEVIQSARDNGVEYLINIGIDMPTNRASVALAHEYDFIYAAVGLHPYDVEVYNAEVRAEMSAMLTNEKVVAVGEIGLDYCKSPVPRDVQIDILKKQIKLAIEHDLPVVIHTRDAWDDIERVIEEASNGQARGVFHCYSGDLETAQRLIKKGFLISFAGNITFKNYKQIEMLEKLPIEKLLIETDSPFLSPHRGKRNEPGNVPLIAQRLADIKDLTQEDVGRITSFNASRLFGIALETQKETIVYPIRDSLYVNPTIRCTADCVFCARLTDPVVKGHNLKLTKEPTSDEVMELIGDPTQYSEIVFCGYGEPLLRLDFIKDVAEWVKKSGGSTRINTNGHGNLIYNRDITPELAGLIDEISVSLNTHDPKHYEKIMRTEFNKPTSHEMLDFLKKSKEAGIKTVASVVGIPGLDIEKCREYAESVGAEFRIRKYNEVG